MGVIAEISDRVAVMYAGRLAEIGYVRDVVKTPQHPYAKGLMDSIPSLHHQVEQLTQIDGAMPRLTEIPPGCPFHPRCDYYKPGVCDLGGPPPLERVKANHSVACYRAAEIHA